MFCVYKLQVNVLHIKVVCFTVMTYPHRIHFTVEQMWVFCKLLALLLSQFFTTVEKRELMMLILF